MQTTASALIDRLERVAEWIREVDDTEWSKTMWHKRRTEWYQKIRSELCSLHEYSIDHRLVPIQALLHGSALDLEGGKIGLMVLEGVGDSIATIKRVIGMN